MNTGVLTFERALSLSALLATLLALVFSAYQSYLMRLSLDSFRTANRNERAMDACVDYLVSIRDFKFKFENWAGKVLGDGPLLSNDPPADIYRSMMIDSGLATLKQEERLQVLFGPPVLEAIDHIQAGRTFAFILSEPNKEFSREDVDIHVKRIVLGVNAIETTCNSELGIN